MARPPRVGWVRIVSADPPLSVDARLGAERPNIDQGFGGWQEVARPRRSPLTTWAGSPALRMTLSILLDGFGLGAHTRGGIADVSVERQIRQLERMGQPSSTDGEPPKLRIVATGGAVPYQGRVWVIDSISYGDALMSWKGNRVRQAMTLALLEHVADVYLTEKSAAARARKKVAQAKTKTGASAKRITVVRGDTLSSIAARKLGDASRWPELAKLNNLRDPHSIKEGQVIRLP